MSQIVKVKCMTKDGIHEFGEPKVIRFSTKSWWLLVLFDYSSTEALAAVCKKCGYITTANFESS